MGAETILTMAIGLSAAVGAFYEGRRRGSSVEMGIATDTVELLQAQVDVLTRDREQKDAIIADLQMRVEMLESLVTQRAEVEAVKVEVIGLRTEFASRSDVLEGLATGVRGVVDRIASKVGV